MLSTSISSEFSNEILGQKFFNKYYCIKKLGEGSFGSIYKANYNNEEYALKFEERKLNYNLLENEAGIMNYLKGPNIPKVKSYGFTQKYNILVMELLGPNLLQIFLKKNFFSVKTVCMIGIQMINILKNIHEKHILHRDIKPENFCLGKYNDDNKIYLIDFGLAKKYRSSRTLVQYPLIIKENKLTGTARYASINALKGYEHSRRDDLESLTYCFIFFLKGELPWQNIKAKTKEEKFEKILEKKIQIKNSELCSNIPYEFQIFLEKVKNLRYEEKPEYNSLQNLLKQIMEKENLLCDYVYDWSCKNKEVDKNNNKDKNETTNEDSSYEENNDGNYHIKRNKKYKNYFEYEEPEVNCTTVCNIF
jgi:serine/threonine protein kinase